MSALPSSVRMIFRALILALLAFAIFGPLLNLLLWAFAERWYFPNKLPLEFGLTYWYRVFQPRGNALASLGTSVWIAVLTVAFSLAVAIPAGYALARLKLPWRGAILLVFLLPQAVPNLQNRPAPWQLESCQRITGRYRHGEAEGDGQHRNPHARPQRGQRVAARLEHAVP